VAIAVTKFERNLYSRFSWVGISLMLIADLFLFRAIGATVWAVQMLWIPITAAGIVNGIGHWWGYRNFETSNASRNCSPWGLVVGGEELHNNHHTYPTSAKLAVKPYELAEMRIARRWLDRDEEMIPNNVKAQVAGAAASSPYLAKLVAMREELRMLWACNNVCAEQLLADLQARLVEAEQSGIGALQQFGLRLRATLV